MPMTRHSRASSPIWHLPTDTPFEGTAASCGALRWAEEEILSRPTTFKVVGMAIVVAFVVGGFGVHPEIGPGTDLPAQAFNGRMSTAEAIAFFADRVERTPGDAVSATILSELHLRRGRETGDVGEYQLAALSAEQALNRLTHHAPAHLALAKARFGLHQFGEAAASAEVAARLDPSLGAEVVLADVAVIRGEVETASRIYADLDKQFDSPSLDARLAYLAELRGDHEQAIDMMAEAASRASKLGHTGEPAAWFHLRLGDLHFDTGRYREALGHYRDALTIFERYPAAEAGLARALAAQERFDEAAQSYERAIAMQPTPAVLASAARMYEHIGMDDEAQRHRSTLDLIAELSTEVLDLAHVHHLIDMGRTTEALQIAERAQQGRGDAAALDALAWAQYHTGMQSEAETSISKALATGTAKAQVLYHAGVIYSETVTPRAIAYLEQALAISPNFDPIDSAAARAKLEGLRS